MPHYISCRMSVYAVCVFYGLFGAQKLPHSSFIDICLAAELKGTNTHTRHPMRSFIYLCIEMRMQRQKVKGIEE